MRRLFHIVSAPLLLAWAGLSLAAPLAEVLSVSGRGEHRPTGDGAWQTARIKQGLEDGHFVRTLEASSMALLFGGQAQIKLGSESLFQVRAPSQATPASLDLKKGRSWSQVKVERSATVASAETAGPSLRVTTPGGVAAIRGTEWAIEVGEDGLTTVAVLEGRVEFGNPQGSVSIGPAEEASARPGEAPVKRQLVDPQGRVQWVAVYRFPWARYPELAADDWQPVARALRDGDYAAANFALRARDRSPTVVLLLAELALARGEPRAAVDWLVAIPPAEPLAAALRAEAALRLDEIATARRVLEAAPAHVETALAAGDLHRLEGEAGPAMAAFARARIAAPADPRGWLGGGRVAAEREDLGVARPLFDAAQRLSPQDAVILAERAHADTLGGDLADARAGYEKALALAPDDYVAWTGLGLLELKSGHAEAALVPLLKATAIEPRYARAALYAGIAYWQLGRAGNALDTFARAARLDPNDPLPHFYAAMIHSDRLEPGAAVAAAQRAIALWPKLKSLNQVASDQKGSANLGTTLARFGLEEWALAAAWQAYTPFWGASHLFLADRTHDTYGKNSELFQGFLADPLVFGADPRRNSLIARPESVLGGRVKAAAGQQKTVEAGGQWTGYRADPLPFAWFADVEANQAKPDDLSLRTDLANFTLGLGVKPSFDTGLFLFANRYRLNLDFPDPTSWLKDTHARSEPTRIDLGYHYKFSPEAHFWLKLGFGDQQRSLRGDIPTSKSVFNGWEEHYEDGPPATVGLDFSDSNRERDAQVKYAWSLGQHSLHVSLEKANGRSYYRIKTTTQDGNDPPLSAASTTATAQDRDSWHMGFGDSIRLNESTQLHLQLGYTRYQQEDTGTFTTERKYKDIWKRVAFGSGEEFSRFSPRIGGVWQFAVSPEQTAGHGTLRMALREWMQPAGASTLDRLDTAGLPLDTRSVRPGGLLKDGKLQLEWEAARNFYVAYLEASRIENHTEGYLPGIAAMLTDLEKLRQKAPDNVSGEDLLEGTPRFGMGRMRTAGLAGNWIVDDRTSVYARAIFRSSEDLRDNPGADLPYSPRRTAVLGTSYFPGGGWSLGAQAVYRSRSFTDSAQTTELPAGWGVDCFAGWRSPDRHWRTTLVAKNLGREQPAPRSLMAQIETWW